MAELMEKVDRAALERIATRLFGYGRLDAPLWFIGYEEHCADESDAARRLPVLAGLEGAVDVFEAHRRWGDMEPKNACTWPEMQRIVEACGLGRAHVGTAASNTFLCELLPFPHRGTGEFYADLYGVLGFRRRAPYERAFLQPRANIIAHAANAAGPKVIVVHRRQKRDKHLLTQLAGPGPVRTVELGGRLWADVAWRDGTLWVRCPNFSQAAGWRFADRSGLCDLVRQGLSR